MIPCPVSELARIARTFGPPAAGIRLELMTRILDLPRLSIRDRSALVPVVEFARAYPDDSRVLRAAEALVARLPPTDLVHEYAWGVAAKLVAVDPGCIDIAWEDFEDPSPLLEVLDLIVHPAESDGLVDPRITLEDWFERRRSAGTTDLALLIRLLAGTPLPGPVRAHLFDSCAIPLRYRGPRIGALTYGRWKRRTDRPHYQRGAILREQFGLPAFIRRHGGTSRRGGREDLAFALRALCARRLEIFPLIHTTEKDVVIVDGGRGVKTMIAGVEPEFRSPFETLLFFLILKNGVAVAYGPAAVFGGCCEMGINLFPEFRGGEIRYFYGHLMRTLHHLFGAEYFFLTRYGMGTDNPEAIRTGAFGFYRKLGFLPTNPAVEALAREEEARRAADPDHRSDRRMLLRLSRTEAFMDLSTGRRRPVDFGRLSSAAGRRLRASERDGHDSGGVGMASRIARAIDVESTSRALRSVAPVLSLIGDMRRWPRTDRAAIARFLRAKDSATERAAGKISVRMPRLLDALHRAAGSEPGNSILPTGTPAGVIQR